MDALDVAILRTMGVRPYSPTPRRLDTLRAPVLARRLGVAVDTIKARLGRMRDVGLLVGYRAIPNLRHLGLTGEAYFFRLGEGAAKARALDGIAAEPGVLEVHDMLGEGLCIEMAHPDSTSWSEGLRRACERTGDASPTPFYDLFVPPVRRPLTHLDWRILRALRADATRSAADIAELEGLSARTVTRHLDRLEGEGSVLAAPVLDLGKAPGLILFELLTFLRPGAGADTVSRVLKTFEPRVIHSFPPKSARLGQFDLVLCATSVAEVEAARRDACLIEGVARAETWLFQGVLDTSAWLDPVIEARIAEAAP
ncbi:MAG: Lrp/AsnC family transcriptional regulator [Thermoplasmatota archaeon]